MTAPADAATYLGEGAGWRAWLLTTDHKRVAWLYLVTLTIFFFIGGAAAVLIRTELVTPAGDLVSDDGYNRLFTIHGIIMVWFFLVPSIPTTLGNFLLPLMIGARDLAFPRLNLLSWYVFLFGSLFTLYAVVAGGIDTGWTFYTPYSTMFANSHVAAAATGVFIVGFSSIMTGINFIVSVHKLRAPGLTWFRLPVFVWTTYATSLVMVLATPVLAATLLMIVLDRVIGVGIFDPGQGGDPLLFQHLFWFYSHPAVYIMILPGMGVVSEVIPCFARRPLFGYKAVALSSMAIALFGFLVWGHHMFVSGQSAYAGIVFSFLSFCVAIPSAIKVFNWTLTLRRGLVSFEAPMLYALGFLGLFTFGGLAGLFLAAIAVDVHLHDTYFVVAHFHYIMVGGMVTAFMGGLHFWWPKMTGRLYSETMARVAAILTFIGFNLTFFPQYILGYLGMPRRYHAYPPEFAFWHILSSFGAAILAIGYLLPLFYLAWSMFRGERAQANPWMAKGLEWRTASPPPPHNFDEMPTVNEPPYNYPLPEGSEMTQPVSQAFRSPQREQSADLLGVWIFIASEALLFGAIFLGYAISRFHNPSIFVEGSGHTDMLLGSVNTAILLTSSFTMALATLFAEQDGTRRTTHICLWLTVALGIAFLGIKAAEYTMEAREGLLPFLRPPNAPRQTTDLFFDLYLAATGLHALHLATAISIVIWLVTRSGQAPIRRTTRTTATGLYWHFVDIVWLFLFPLLYLVR